MPRLRAVWLVWLLVCSGALLHAAPACAAAGVSTTPALPLVDVAFCAVPPPLPSGGSGELLASLSSDCTAGLLAATAACSGAAGYAFNVTSAWLGLDLSAPVIALPSTYWCLRSGGGALVNVGTLQMNLVQTTPMYYIRRSESSVTFNDATPADATLGFYQSPACTSLLDGTSTFTLGSSRTVSLNAAINAVYICGSVASPVGGGGGAMTLRNTLISGAAYAVSPSTGVRHSTVLISTGTNNMFYFALSSSPTCSDLPVPDASSVVSAGSANVTIDKPRGTYYFCGAEGSRVYVPATNTFEVLEYGVQPHSSYVGLSTRMSLSLDASGSTTMQLALFSSPDCATGLVQAWSVTGGRWQVENSGTYYACVRASSTAVAYYANAYVVAKQPSLITAPAAPVLGFPLTVTLDGDVMESAVYTVGLAMSIDGCAYPFARANLSAADTSAQLDILASSAGTLLWCLSNPILDDPSDSSEATTVVTSSLATVAARSFRLGYDALRVGTATVVALDREVLLGVGTAVSFVRVDPASASRACDAVTGVGGAAEVVSAVAGGNVLASVTFPSAGLWAACARRGGVYTLLRAVQVYEAAAQLSVGVLVVGAAVAVRVAAVPEGAAVTVVSGATCAAPSAVLATSVWSAEGYAALNVTASAAATLLVCVAYPSFSAAADASTASVVLGAGTVAAARASVYPSVAHVGGATTLWFGGAGRVSLAGYEMRLVRGASCSGAAASPLSAALSGPGGGAGSASYGTLGANVLAAGAVYGVCVGTDGAAAYALAGTVAAANAPTLATDTTPRGVVVQGLPVRVALPTAYVAATGVDVFVVVDGAADCTADLAGVAVHARGAISAATGAADAFVAPAASSGVTALRVCVGVAARLVSATLGYVAAGALAAERFHTSTTRVQQQRYNRVAGWPESTASGAELLLAACSGRTCDAAVADATCGSARLYATSPTVAFTGALGTYLVCQRVPLGARAYVAGSNTTVQADAPYTMATSTAELRVHEEFTLTLGGGASGALEGERVVTVQPASAACGAAAVSESQNVSVVGGSGAVVITAVAGGQAVRFCLVDAALGSVELGTVFLLAYTTPAAVIAGTATTLVSGAPRAGASAMLATGSDCAAAVTGGAARALVGGAATFTVAGCDATTRALKAVHYCETGEGGQLVWRGAVQLLRASSCSGGELASILPVSAAPGVAIVDYGLATSVLTRPWLSASPSCDGAVDRRVETVGYAPRFGESAVFYVCAELANASSVVFTTAAPTLTVLSWRASPSAALSRFNATMGVLRSTSVSLNYATPTAATFFSASSACEGSLGSAAALGTTGGAAAYRTTGVRGLVYVCTTDPLSASTIAVAALLSVTPPSVVRAAPAIVVGVTYTATLVVDGEPPLYAMQPGADAAYAYSAYYTSRDRYVFLSADGCATGIAGVADATAAADGRVRLATSAISAAAGSVALCAGTAAGTAVVLAAVPVATGNVYPTTLVSGAPDGVVYVPRSPSQAFTLSASAGDCTLTAGMPSFTTDSEGYGSVSLVGADGAALPTGTYTLCYGAAARGGDGGGSVVAAVAAALAADTLAPLETVSLVAPVHYAVAASTFVVGVAAVAELQGDLVSSDLLADLSTTPNCTSMTGAYGTWARVSDRSIRVEATSAAPMALYLCAVAPVNGSLVALPDAAGLRFATSSIELPASGWDACTTYAVGQCYPPGSSSATASDTLAMVHGGCCSATRVVVGESSMAGGACQLAMDGSAVEGFAANATFDLCVLSSTDAAACATVATGVRVSTSCRASSGDRGLSSGALAAAVSCSILGVLGLIVAAIVIYCCCYRKRAAEKLSATEEESRSAKRDGDRRVSGTDTNTVAEGSEAARNVLAPAAGAAGGLVEPVMEALHSSFVWEGEAKVAAAKSSAAAKASAVPKETPKEAPGTHSGREGMVAAQANDSRSKPDPYQQEYFTALDALKAALIEKVQMFDGYVEEPLPWISVNYPTGDVEQVLLESCSVAVVPRYELQQRRLSLLMPLMDGEPVEGWYAEPHPVAAQREMPFFNMYFYVFGLCKHMVEPFCFYLDRELGDAVEKCLAAVEPIPTPGQKKQGRKSAPPSSPPPPPPATSTPEPESISLSTRPLAEAAAASAARARSPEVSVTDVAEGVFDFGDGDYYGLPSMDFTSPSTTTITHSEDALQTTAKKGSTLSALAGTGERGKGCYLYPDTDDSVVLGSASRVDEGLSGPPQQRGTAAKATAAAAAAGGGRGGNGGEVDGSAGAHMPCTDVSPSASSFELYSPLHSSALSTMKRTRLSGVTLVSNGASGLLVRLRGSNSTPTNNNNITAAVGSGCPIPAAPMKLFRDDVVDDAWLGVGEPEAAQNPLWRGAGQGPAHTVAPPSTVVDLHRLPAVRALPDLLITLSSDDHSSGGDGDEDGAATVLEDSARDAYAQMLCEAMRGGYPTIFEACAVIITKATGRRHSSYNDPKTGFPVEAHDWPMVPRWQRAGAADSEAAVEPAASAPAAKTPTAEATRKLAAQLSPCMGALLLQAEEAWCRQLIEEESFFAFGRTLREFVFCCEAETRSTACGGLRGSGAAGDCRVLSVAEMNRKASWVGPFAARLLCQVFCEQYGYSDQRDRVTLGCCHLSLIVQCCHLLWKKQIRSVQAFCTDPHLVGQRIFPKPRAHAAPPAAASSGGALQLPPTPLRSVLAQPAQGDHGQLQQSSSSDGWDGSLTFSANLASPQARLEKFKRNLDGNAVADTRAAEPEDALLLRYDPPHPLPLGSCSRYSKEELNFIRKVQVTAAVGKAMATEAENYLRERYCISGNILEDYFVHGGLRRARQWQPYACGRHATQLWFDVLVGPDVFSETLTPAAALHRALGITEPLCTADGKRFLDMGMLSCITRSMAEKGSTLERCVCVILANVHLLNTHTCVYHFSSFSPHQLLVLFCALLDVMLGGYRGEYSSGLRAVAAESVTAAKLGLSFYRDLVGVFPNVRNQRFLYWDIERVGTGASAKS